VGVGAALSPPPCEPGAGRIRSLVDGVIALAVAIAIVSVKVGLTGH
jgi:hypothetical protein